MPLSVSALFTVLLAIVLAAGLSALAARSSRRRGHPEVGPWWGALAVGLGYSVAHLGVATPAFPPSDVTDRIPIVALAGAVVASILAGRQGVLWARVVGSVGLATLVYLVMLGPVLGAGEYSSDTITQLATIGGVSLLGMLNVGLLDSPSVSRRRELWVALMVLAVGSGVVLVLANSAVLFLLSGCLAMVLLAALLGAKGLPVGGGIPVASAVLTALVVEGSVYAFLPMAPALLLAGAPGLLWLLRIGPIARLGPLSRLTLVTVLMLIPLGIAGGLVWASRTNDGYGI